MPPHRHASAHFCGMRRRRPPGAAWQVRPVPGQWRSCSPLRAQNPRARWESGTGVHPRPRQIQIGDGDGDGPPIPGRSAGPGDGTVTPGPIPILGQIQWGCQWGRRAGGWGSGIPCPGARSLSVRARCHTVTMPAPLGCCLEVSDLSLGGRTGAGLLIEGFVVSSWSQLWTSINIAFISSSDAQSPGLPRSSVKLPILNEDGLCFVSSQVYHQLHTSCTEGLTTW